MHMSLPIASSIPKPAARALKQSFDVEGARCAATLHLPAQAATPHGHPAILMVHGWGGTQEALTRPYVQHFVDAGWAVMEFDYPGWGASGGWPRQHINPWRRVRAADAALAHLKQQEGIHAHRIVLWGTSFGGGHVIDLACQHRELLGVIAQVPMLDGRKAVAAVPLGRLLRFGAYALADLLVPGVSIDVPIVAPAGQFASMDRDGAYDALAHSTMANARAWDNRVSARSLLTMGLYRPITRLHKLRVPTLLLGADRDSVAPFVEAAIRRVAPACVRTQVLKGNHFEPYAPPLFTAVISAQLAFLHELLSQAEGAATQREVWRQRLHAQLPG